MDQAREIGQSKMADLNANDIEAAAKIIAGTARSMGINVEGCPQPTPRGRAGAARHPRLQGEEAE